jgi:hypothetical protein
MKKLAIAMIAAMSLSVFAFANDEAKHDAPAADAAATTTEVKHEETTKMKGHDGKMHKSHKKTKKTTEEAHHE